MQDCFAHEILKRKRGGFFIDLAANDALTFSNTRTLERDHDWHGLCIEPNPLYHAELRLLRNCTLVPVAVAQAREQRLFEFMRALPFRGAWAYTKGVVGHLTNKPSNTTAMVNTVPLADILTEHAVPRTIDFLSLDVEGSEALAMATFPWSTHTITVITAEVTHASSLGVMLRGHGYRQLCRIGHQDSMWVHSESLRKRGAPAWADQSHPNAACEALITPHAPQCARAARMHAVHKYAVTGKMNATEVRLLLSSHGERSIGPGLGGR